MNLKTFAVAATAVLAGIGTALAQTTTPSTTPSTPATPPPAASAPSTPSTSATGDNIVLTEDQARSWVDKVIYSSDGRNVGEVAAFTRDASGKVTELHADIGGVMGLGETRVRIMPSQFTLGADRVNLKMTAEQAKSLPQVPKQ